MRTGARIHARTLGARACVRCAVRVRVMHTQHTHAHVWAVWPTITLGYKNKICIYAYAEFDRYMSTNTGYVYGLPKKAEHVLSNGIVIPIHRKQSKHDSRYIYIPITLPMRTRIQRKICSARKECVLTECQYVSMYASVRICGRTHAAHAHIRLRTSARPHP
jgi:hypothetical protein